MKSLECLLVAAKLKALKEQGLSNRDIVQLVKSDGREAVLELVA